MSALLALLLAVRIAPIGDAPAKQPQIAARGNAVVLTYGAGNAVYFSRSDDGGKTSARPVLISDQGNLSLGMHRGPRIAVSPNAIVVSAVVGVKGKGADGDLLAWRSLDEGKTWSTAVRVNDIAGSAREGLHSMASDGKGLIFSTWLDLREKGTRLYGSVSGDGGATWSKNVLVYASPSGSICQCCHPSATIGEDGRISVMFRNEVAGARDMYLASSTNSGKSFTPAQKLGRGTWTLNACPMDGGGITRDGNGKVVTVWRREKTIYTAAAGEDEKSLGTGKDASIVLGKAGLYFSWTAPDGVRAITPGHQDQSLLDTRGAYVQLARLNDGSVVATWESEGSIVIEKLP